MHIQLWQTLPPSFYGLWYKNEWLMIATSGASLFQVQLEGLSELKKTINVTKSNITDTENKLIQAFNMSSNLTDRAAILEVRLEKIIEELDSDVKLRLNDIDLMLKRANTLLKFTSPVMKFNGQTSSKPAVPPAIQRETRYLNVLMYAKPEKPDGLLMFMGNTITSDNYRQKRKATECKTDFAAVELRAAKPCLKLCASGKYFSFEANRNITTDGKTWYKVEANM